MTKNFNAPGKAAYRVVYLVDGKETMEREVFLLKPPNAALISKWKEGLKRTSKGRPVSINVFSVS